MCLLSVTPGIACSWHVHKPPYLIPEYVACPGRFIGRSTRVNIDKTQKLHKTVVTPLAAEPEELYPIIHPGFLRQLQRVRYWFDNKVIETRSPARRLYPLHIYSGFCIEIISLVLWNNDHDSWWRRGDILDQSRHAAPNSPILMQQGGMAASCCLSHEHWVTETFNGGPNNRLISKHLDEDRDLTADTFTSSVWTLEVLSNGTHLDIRNLSHLLWQKSKWIPKMIPYSLRYINYMRKASRNTAKLWP